jgi:hypothetical protein
MSLPVWLRACKPRAPRCAYVPRSSFSLIIAFITGVYHPRVSPASIARDYHVYSSITCTHLSIVEIRARKLLHLFGIPSGCQITQKQTALGDINNREVGDNGVHAGQAGERVG